MRLQQFDSVVRRLQPDGVEALSMKALQQAVVGDDEIAVHTVVAFAESKLAALR